MDKKPIIVIDDDDEDLELILLAFSELAMENEIIVFNDGLKFLDHIRSTEERTFFILCDINMHKISGLELKKMIYDDEALRIKCVPFIFMSTSDSSSSVMKAYSYGVQGYFIKPNSIEKLKSILHSMITYWSESQHPNF
ncbi:response regulator [Spirosoma fluviale]|uniref:Response regulator receiver domain-containing protein n=1 Tax=Spirosoma fluviale TaxID=1597977 RepID=A0A286G4W5_9BACT|nr:response regulator [Spirosoma fluviale]SOD90522.1 Response regulator receiver domain-containing protein [Spirosoma fluviale]